MCDNYKGEQRNNHTRAWTLCGKIRPEQNKLIPQHTKKNFCRSLPESGMMLVALFTPGQNRDKTPESCWDNNSLFLWYENREDVKFFAPVLLSFAVSRFFGLNFFCYFFEASACSWLAKWTGSGFWFCAMWWIMQMGGFRVVSGDKKIVSLNIEKKNLYSLYGQMLQK